MTIPTDGDETWAAYLAATRDIIARLVDDPEVSIAPDAHLLDDVGLDSFGVLVFITELEDRFGVLLPAGEEEPVLSTIYRHVVREVGA